MTVKLTAETGHFGPNPFKYFDRYSLFMAVESINCKAFSHTFCLYKMFGFDDFLAIE